jgi:hypothetical protein
MLSSRHTTAVAVAGSSSCSPCQGAAPSTCVELMPCTCLAMPLQLCTKLSINPHNLCSCLASTDLHPHHQAASSQQNLCAGARLHEEAA